MGAPIGSGAMRAVAVVIALAGALALSGCGGGGGGERSALSLKLAALCEQARSDFEELGPPEREGFDVIPKLVKIGLRLASTIATLEGESDVDREQIRTLASRYESYWKEIDLGYGFYELGNAKGLKAAVEQATPELEAAEALATQMGAPECAERPFGDLRSLSR